MRDGPLRCPFCHESVEREQEPWIACEACLARHHAACWSEGGGCAGCKETRGVGPTEATAQVRAASGAARVEANAAGGSRPAEPVSLEGPPSLLLELRGTRAHFEGPSRLALIVEPSTNEPFELRVRNDTGKPKQVELRRLPAWITVEGPAARTIEPGQEGVFACRVDAALAPWQRGVSPVGQRGVYGGIKMPVSHASAELVLSTDEDSRTVSLDAYRELGPTARALLGGFLGLAAHVGLIFWLILLFAGRRPAPHPGEDSPSFAFRRRQAEAARRMARPIGIGLLGFLVAALTVLVLVLALR